MSAEMTPLDHILQSEVNDCNEMSLNVWRLVVDEASAELNQLRAAAAERETYKKIVDDAMIPCETCHGSGFSNPGTGYDAVCSDCSGGHVGYASGEMVNELTKECDELKRTVQAQRVQIALLDDYAETIRQHEITITAQDEQLNQAREFLTHLVRCWHDGCDTCDDVRAWLAANAPQDVKA